MKNENLDKFPLGAELENRKLTTQELQEETFIRLPYLVHIKTEEKPCQWLLAFPGPDTLVLYFFTL